ncbi:MAG: DUF2510 domain-containing protein [Acidimicrobiales bacterium]
MSGGTEAGWHNDPMGRHESRYWNGTEWTEHVSNAGVQGVDPIEPAVPAQTAEHPATPTQPAPTDPTQPIVPVAGADAGQPVAGEPLPQYANTGAQKSGGFPVVPVVIGLVVAAVVIGGLIFAIGGGDDGGDDFGESVATLEDENPVVRYDLSLDAGEGVRFRAEPKSGDLDPVFVMAVGEDTANDLFSDLVAEDFFFEDADFDEFFTDVVDDALDDYDTDDTGIDRGQLYEIDNFDDNGSGGVEAHSFVAPGSATYSLLLYDWSEQEGELDVTIERWDGTLQFDSLSDFVTELSDVTSDDDFFTEEDFFTEGGFSDFSDSFSDFTDDTADDFSDFTDSFSDFSDFSNPFEDFSDFSDFEDLSDLTDFIDPFTDLFTDFFSEFSDLAG